MPGLPVMPPTVARSNGDSMPRTPGQVSIFCKTALLRLSFASPLTHKHMQSTTAADDDPRKRRRVEADDAPGGVSSQTDVSNNLIVILSFSEPRSKGSFAVCSRRFCAAKSQDYPEKRTLLLAE
jgi:hypothetical protein